MHTAHAMTTEQRSVARRTRERAQRPGPPPGIVFVPCVLCLEPVDLAIACERDGRPMCEPHRAANDLPLG